MEWWIGEWRGPFRFISRFGRLLEDLLRDWEELGYESAPLGLGRTDVYFKDSLLVIETELPGVEKEDIRVQVEGDRIVVTGEVRRTEEVREEDYIRMGRRYGAFRRVFPLPEEVEDPGKVKARFRNGILRIEVPLRRRPERGGAFDVQIE